MNQKIELLSKKYQLEIAKTTTALIVVLAVLFFHQGFEKIIETIGIHKLLALENGRILNDFIFFLIGSGLIIHYTRLCINGYRSSFYSFLFAASTILLYLSYRLEIVECQNQFARLELWPKLAYADLLFLVFAGQLSVLIFKINQTPHQNNYSALLEDTELGCDYELGDEILGYTSYAKLVADKIKQSYFEKAFAIGINAKWGSGKTTFVNIIKHNFKHEIKQEKIIWIDFSPWYSGSSDAIIKDFLDSVQESLKPFGSELEGLFDTYANKLLQLNDNSVSRFFKIISSLFSVNESTSKGIYEHIDKQLKLLGKKLVIFIDDLDRLHDKELLETIRLIRNTGNFNNTVFLVAYDKNYVLNALSKVNPTNHHNFLDKIIQLELSLPAYPSYILTDKLNDILLIRLPEIHHGAILEALSNDNSFAKIDFSFWITNLRDVKRLVNNLCLNFELLQSEVLFKDMLHLELLRLKFPAVHQLLFQQRSYFFMIDNKVNGSKYDVYTFKNDLSGIPNIKRHLENTEISQQLHLNEVQISGIMSLLNTVFNPKMSIRNKENCTSVRVPSFFELYFSYCLPASKLSHVEFHRARLLSPNDFQARIKDWIEKGLEQDIKLEFENITEFNSREDFEQIVRAIFFFANQKTQRWNRTQFGAFVYYPLKSLESILDNYQNKVSDRFFGGNMDSYAEFLLAILNGGCPPYYYEHECIKEFIKNTKYENGYHGYFPLKPGDLEKILLNKFLNELQIEQNWSVAFDSLLQKYLFDCRFDVWQPVNSSGTSPRYYVIEEIREPLKKFLLKGALNDFLHWSITEPPFSQGQGVFMLKAVFNFLFKSIDDYVAFVIAQDEGKWSYLGEYNEFLLALKQKSWSEPVPFNFKTIPIH